MLEKIDTMICPICTALMSKGGGNGYGIYKKKFKCGLCKIEVTIKDLSHKDHRRNK